MSPDQGTGGVWIGLILGVNLPFRRAGKILLAALACLAFGQASYADQAKENSFLKLSQGQRYWWLHGAATTTAHLVAMRDKAKGDCVAQWYLSDPEKKQKLLEDSLALNPAELPTTVLLALMTRACGDLVPK